MRPSAMWGPGAWLTPFSHTVWCLMMSSRVNSNLCAAPLQVIIREGRSHPNPALDCTPSSASEPLCFTAVYRIEAPFGSSPVFISAFSCLVSTDLTYRFVPAQPPRYSPVRPLQPGTLLFGLCSLQQSSQLDAQIGEECS